MFPTSDPLDSHISAVRALGVTPPLDWTELVECFERYTCLDERPSTARLVSAVVDPENGDDIVALRADAFAEATALPPARAEVTAAIRAAVLTSLREYYEPHAVANYASAADYYDDLAQKFTAAADLVDPETDAAAMVDEPEKLRRAWSSAEQLAHRLTAALAGLSAAASLAGVPTDQEHLIALTVDPTGCHRRRCGQRGRRRHGRTGTMGRAARHRCHAARRSTLDGLRPTARPSPMEVKQIPTGLGIRQVPYDPEDDELQTTAAP